MKDGGTAFPTAYVGQNGMSLRDYFAAKAMQGLLAKGVEYQKDAEEFVTNLAAACYRFADRLLAEREKNNVDR